MKIKLIVDGGAMKPGPAVAQQLGPMGVNLGKVIEDVNKETQGFRGMKVPVEIDVNPKTKNYKIEVFSPTVAELIKKEMGIEKASGEAGKSYAGNIAFETILGIAKTKQPGLLAKDLRAAVKLVVGTCVSMGVLIDSKEAKEIERDIDAGKYDKEIKEEKTEPSEEKKKELDEFWKDLTVKQEMNKKAAEAAKVAEEAKKTEEAASGKAEGEEKKEEEPKKEEPKKKEGKKK
ncbi:MAG: 50S ribosomal protein L11 [Nanoarchaeota archaeon]|nr:50S ribosomal protein L11 [Nanoarchaeota archaeon]MBU1104080.1 50S ribosomal protein L11 [Nanoarchaeota archaeon]